MSTKQEQLDKIQTAIDRLLDGGAVQAYSIGGRNIQYMSLDQLYKARERLMAEISRQKGSTNYATFKDPL